MFFHSKKKSIYRISSKLVKRFLMSIQNFQENKKNGGHRAFLQVISLKLI